MLDVKFVRENPEIVKKALKDKGIKLDIEEFLGLDKTRRELVTEVEALKRQKNEVSDKIGEIMREKKNPKDFIGSMKVVSQKIAEIEAKVEEINQKYANFVYNIPNIPHESVNIGPGPEANKVVKEWGVLPKFDFEPRTHLEIGEILDILDFGRATKIAGTGFALYKGLGARMERALFNFMLDLHTKKHGYKEIFPPFLVNRRSMTGTGQLPKLEEDMYRLKDDDLFLIPTAEVPVTNIHADEVLEEDELPIRYTAYTACFRREAGSYGKDTKGLTRVHQFDKVELVKFVEPRTSYEELEKLLADAEEVIQLLELPYRVIALSTGDLSFAASKCYDIELWAPGLKRWLEVSSCSNFTDFQARRANIKFRSRQSKKLQFVHTLNGSGVALARLVIAILEIHQNKDSGVNIPRALRPYMDGLESIKPE
ncbi:MAG: serine--tRNA ligase [Omnitrophica bacterium RBG_13_46_9]|nr:MAG: serine--tRNA ligase [Omnitrophica bacterium RBG_13_46_9]